MENMVNANFWRNKTVFITGHTGFKGSWLTQWLVAMGAKVTGYALAPHTSPNLFELLQLQSHYHSIIADVREQDKLLKAMQTCKPDVVLHLAAQPLVRASYSDPVNTYTTNVIGTVHVFEAVRQTSSVKVVINVTTDKCYENYNWAWGYRENDRLGGFDPYSNSKACSELVTSAYRHSFFKNADSPAIASARAGNVIGGGDWSEDRLIPDIIRALCNKQTLNIRYPHATRPWQHVLEPLSGYLCLAQRLWESPQEYIGSWNFGPQQADIQPVSHLLELFNQHWPTPLKWNVDKNQHPHEAHCLSLDISKALSLLKWQPQWSLDITIAHTAKWYQCWQESGDLQHFTLGQITHYMSSLPGDQT